MTNERGAEPIDRQAASPRRSGAESRAELIPRGSWLWVATAGGAALALAVALLAALWFFQRPLAVLFLGLTVAAAMAPAVRWVEKWLPRTLAVVATYVILVLVLVLLGAIVVPPVVDQARQMAERTPELADQAQRWFRRRFRVSDATILDQLVQQVAGLGSTLVALPLEISGSVLDLLLVGFLSLYALIAAPDAHRVFLSAFPEDQEEKVTCILRKLAHAMGGYVRGAVITGAIIGTFAYVGLLLIGVNFPLVLAIVSGILEFIPFVGPFIAGGVIVIVALLQSPTKALISLAFVIGLQQVEGNLISPNVMHPHTCISPLMTLFAIFAGWTVGGVLGALIAVPLAAALRVLFVELLLPAVQRRTSAESQEAGPSC